MWWETVKQQIKRREGILFNPSSNNYTKIKNRDNICIEGISKMIKLKLPTAAYFRKIMKKEKKKRRRKKQHSFQIRLKLNDSVCHSRGTKKKNPKKTNNYYNCSES